MPPHFDLTSQGPVVVTACRVPRRAAFSRSDRKLPCLGSTEKEQTGTPRVRARFRNRLPSAVRQQNGLSTNRGSPSSRNGRAAGRCSAPWRWSTTTPSTAPIISSGSRTMVGMRPDPAAARANAGVSPQTWVTRAPATLLSTFRTLAIAAVWLFSAPTMPMRIMSSSPEGARPGRSRERPQPQRRFPEHPFQVPG